MKLGMWDSPEAGQPNWSIENQGLPAEVVPELPIAVFDPLKTGLGEPLKTPWRATIEPIARLRVRQGVVFGQRFVKAGDHLFSDYALNDHDIQQIIGGKTGLREEEHGLIKTEDGYDSNLLANNTIDIRGAAAFVTSFEPNNYGAWLIRTLPKIQNIRSQAGSDSVKYLCYCQQSWQKRLLSFLGLKDDQIVEQKFSENYRVENLIVPYWPNRSSFIGDESRSIFVNIRKQAVKRRSGAESPKLIYVSRQNWSGRSDAAKRYRPFRQEEELVARLESLGVTPYCPEKFPIEDVVATFANARLVIGPQGAGMFNSVFCSPGTEILDIEHLPYFLRAHSNIFASMGLRYRIVCGAVDEEVDSHPSQRGLRIDMEAVVSYVEGVIRELSA